MALKRVFTAALGLTLATGVAACGANASSDDSKISVAVYSSRLVTDMPAIYASELGFLEEQGLTAEFVEVGSGTDMTNAVISGTAFVGDLATPSGLRVVAEQNQPLTALAGGAAVNFRLVTQPDAFDTANSLSEEQRVAQLKGKTIMVIGRGTLTDWWLADLLNRAGLTEDDVTVLATTTTSGQIGAFETGEVDAIVAFDNSLPGLGVEGEDYDIFVGIPEGDTGDVYDGYLQSYWATSSKNAGTDKASKFCTALSQTAAWMADETNRDEAIDILADWTGQERAAAEKLFADNTFTFALTGEVWEKQAVTVGLDAAPDYGQYVDAECTDVLEDAL